MKFCRSCKLSIENNLDRCPLCGNITDKTDDKFNDDYPIVKKSFISQIINRAILFLTIAVSIVTIFINLTVSTQYPWSVVAIVGVIYLGITTKFIIEKSHNYGLLSLFHVLLSCAIVAAVDSVFGFAGWSVDYVIPFIIISGSLSISIVSIIKPFKYKEYIVYLLIIAVLGIVPLILYFSGIAKVFWTNAVCVIYSACVVLAMFIFTRRRLNAELKRRLHF
ncbi:MAG: DUF6320 domain-containing protein [Oscillospiraceae bacterium]